MSNTDLTKPILTADGIPTRPTVEFTEDEWTTKHIGYCVESTFYSYLVDGRGYGRFWIPKQYVRLIKQ